MEIKKILSVFFSVMIGLSLSAGELKIKDGESIAFLGDSITFWGMTSPGGYIHLVISGLNEMGVKSKAIPAGVSGHKSTQMNSRVNNDVIRKKPTWMTLSCGVNDVWHGKNGVPLEQYKKEITALLDKVDQAGIKVMIFTATMITEDPEHDLNKKLIPYNEWLRQIAKERNYLLADLNAAMQQTIKQKKQENPGIKGNILTQDGVHMAFSGNKMMARGILQAFGASEEDIQRIEKQVWTKIPYQGYTVYFNEIEMESLQKSAAAQNTSIINFIRSATMEKADAVVKSGSKE